MIEIDNCSPLEVLKLQKNLLRITEGEGIRFVCGKGKHKPEIQKLYEGLEEVTADSGYCSEKNLLYLKENGIASYIKLQDHEKKEDSCV